MRMTAENIAEKRCYTVKEVQEILDVSRPTVYALLKKKCLGSADRLYMSC